MVEKERGNSAENPQVPESGRRTSIVIEVVNLFRSRLRKSSETMNLTDVARAIIGTWGIGGTEKKYVQHEIDLLNDLVLHPKEAPGLTMYEWSRIKQILAEYHESRGRGV